MALWPEWKNHVCRKYVAANMHKIFGILFRAFGADCNGRVSSEHALLMMREINSAWSHLTAAVAAFIFWSSVCWSHPDSSQLGQNQSSGRPSALWGLLLSPTSGGAGAGLILGGDQLLGRSSLERLRCDWSAELSIDNRVLPLRTGAVRVPPPHVP